MAITNISAVAGNQDLPQYVAPLFFEKGHEPCSLLRLAGGSDSSPQLGGRTVTTTEFSLSADYQLEAAAQPSITPGAAPGFKEYGIEQSTNIVQPFHRGVGMNYDVMGDQDAFAGLQVAPGGSSGEIQKIRSIDKQIAFNLAAMRRDMNYTFLNGAFHKSTTNTDPALSRGLITAITTNSSKNGGTGRALSVAIVNAHLRAMVDNRSMVQGQELFVICGSAQYAALTALYTANNFLQPQSYSVAGLAIKKVMTDWAILNLIWEPMVPNGQIVFVQADKLQPAMKLIPGKGLLFVEALAKIGSSDRFQLYCEAGLDYGNEFFHGLIGDLS